MVVVVCLRKFSELYSVVSIYRYINTNGFLEKLQNIQGT